jgi:hypothetical protein
MSSRLPRECRCRYKVLQEKSEKSSFTAQEELLLFSLFLEFGGRWIWLRSKFKGHSVDALKKRLAYLRGSQIHERVDQFISDEQNSSDAELKEKAGDGIYHD